MPASAQKGKTEKLLKDEPKEELSHDGEKVEQEWEEPLFPSTAILVVIYAVILSIMILGSLITTSIGPRFEKLSPDELWHAKVAILLIVSSFITEMCFLASSATNAYFMGWTISSQLQMHRMGDSLLTLMEYGTKALTGLIIWLGEGGVVHADTLAIGGPRPVYLARFLQWALAVPTLILITNRTFVKSDSGITVIARSAPSAIAAFLYCWASWLMEVTTSRPVRWTMLCMCILGHILVSMDQIKLALAHRREALFSWKACMLTYQLTTFTVYAIIFLAGRMGLMSSLVEQGIYAYADASIKVFQGAILAMIRNREDLVAIRHWWMAALTASKDLETLIHKARVPVFALDIDGRIVEWNSNLEELTNLEFDDIKGQRLTEIVESECRELLQEVLDKVVSAGLTEQPVLGRQISDSVVASSAYTSSFVEISISVKGGPVEVRQLAMTLVPKSTNDGQLAGVVAIGQDLSDLAQLKIVQERKSALMAMLSHEIRSPLHGMVGLTGAILETDAAKGLHRQLGMVKCCAARLLDLVTNIMDLAQHEKRKRDGRPAPKPTEPVNFAAIADEVAVMTNMAVDRMNKPLLRSSVRLVNKLSEGKVPMIRGDPQKCTQLLYNLVTNACKFTERGTVTLQARHIQDTDMLEVDVIDTGKGISKEGQTRIFQAFEQEQNGDARGFQGIGLGLAVCTEICELHGGELRVRSELGQGSTFTVVFTVAPELGFGTCEPIADSYIKMNFQSQASTSSGYKSNEVNGSTMTSLRSHTSAISEFKSNEAQTPTSKSIPLAPPVSASAPSTPTAQTPTSKSIPLARRPPPVSALAPSTPPSNGLPLVLSVDDDEVNQEVVRGALKGLCEIFCAMSGNEAIKYLESRKGQNKKLPDTVLLDIQMPGMDGFEVCDEIRKRFEAAHSRMPIIMISAKVPVDQTAIQSFVMGTTDFVPKPFNTEVLRRKVDIMLNAKRDYDLGGATTTVACEARSRMKETLVRLEEETTRSKMVSESLKQQEQKTKETQAKLDQAQTKVTMMEQGEEHFKKQIAELQAQNAALKKEVSEAKEQAQEAKQQAQEDKNQGQEAKEQGPGANEAAASAALAAKLAEAERERTKAAEARREQAERKAQEMRSMVETLTEKLKRQESMMSSKPVKEAPTAPSPLGMIKAMQLKAAHHSGTAQLGASIGAGPATAEEGAEGDLSLVVEQQRALIGAILQQMSSARAVIRALSSRIEILNALSRGCSDMLQMQPPFGTPALMLDSAPQDRYSDDAEETSRGLHFDWLRTVTRILGAQLTMMEQMSMPPQDLTSIAQHVDTTMGQLCDGPSISSMTSDILFMGASPARHNSGPDYFCP